MKQRLLSIVILLLLFTTSPHLFAQQAPDFNLPGDHGQINLNDYRGKVVYLDFWASWCAPCRKSFPWMNALNDRFKDKGLVIIAINLDEDKALTKRFIDDTQPNFTLAYDSSGKSAERYGLKGMPSSYLIGRDGQLISQHIGFRTKEVAKIESEIASLLNSPEKQ